MSATLDAVEEALANGEAGEALLLARTEWRDRRDGDLACAIDALSAAATRFVPPKARKNSDFQEAWLAVCATDDPLAVPWLVDMLVKRLPRDEPDPTFIARLFAMRSHPDPRFAAALVALVVEGRDIARWCREDLAATLSIVGDARTRESLEELVALEHRGHADWSRVLSRLPPTRAVSADEAQRWRRIASPDGADLDVDGLLAAVYAAPEDSGPRRVLADALMESGDPRGEFIVLQLQEAENGGTETGTKRADALLAAHKDAWLGALQPVVYRAWFREGFLDRIELDAGRRAPAKAWEKLARHPSLATVRGVDRGKAPKHIHELFLNDALRSLASVEIASNAVADALERSMPPRLRDVRSAHWTSGPYLTGFRQRVLPLLTAMPTVRAVTISEEALPDLLDSDVLARLTSIGVFTDFDPETCGRLLALPAHITAVDLPHADPEPSIALWNRLPWHVRRMRLDENVRLVRDGGRTTLVLEVHRARDPEVARSPHGIQGVLQYAERIAGLHAIRVEAFTDSADLSSVTRERPDVEVDVVRRYTSGLTRPFAS
jgi:uncharacterized protein (TIGR02996 family)